MTKKHFEAFARVIREDYNEEHLDRDTAMRMASMVWLVAERDNPRFDRARFLKACGL